MKDFKTLKIWEYAHQLSIDIYQISKNFPKEELFGLTSQIRRAIVSIELNIAEGCGRGSDAELRRFLQIAFGSASEVECCILLIRDLDYISQEKWDNIQCRIEEIKRMLTAFINKLK